MQAGRGSRFRRVLVALALAGATVAVADAPPAHAVGATISVSSTVKIEGSTASRSMIFFVSTSDQATEKCLFKATISFPGGAGSANGGDVVSTAVINGFVAANSFEAQFVVPIVSDTIDEGDEFLVVTIAGRGATPCDIDPARNSAGGTIIDDDPGTVLTSVLTLHDATTDEGSGGSIFTGALPLTLTNAFGNFCSVNASATVGTAKTPADYVFPGEDGKSVDQADDAIGFGIVGDDVPEPVESFTITIGLNSTSDPECTIGDGTATATITDDDFPTISIADTVKVERTNATPAVMNFAVTSAPSTVTCTYQATLTHGTTDSTDFVATAPVTRTQQLNGTSNVGFKVVGDGTPEPDETYTITLAGTGARPCAIGDGQATGTIRNDDWPSISTDDATTVEPDTASRIARFIVRSAPMPTTCTYKATLTHGTTDAADFLSTAPLTITHSLTGVSSAVFRVAGDLTLEPNETFTVTITGVGATPCPVADGVGAGQITNDD